LQNRKEEKLVATRQGGGATSLQLELARR